MKKEDSVTLKDKRNIYNLPKHTIKHFTLAPVLKLKITRYAVFRMSDAERIMSAKASSNFQQETAE